MQNTINTKLSDNNGKPRVWLEGRKLAVGFNAGDTYSIVYDKQTREVKLSLDPNGRYTVNKRTKVDRIEPLIELRDKELLDLYDFDTRLTIIVTKGQVTCRINAIDAKNQTTAEKFLAKILNGEPLTKGTVFTGGGIIDRAVNEGLKHAGIDSKVALVVESEKMYLEAFMRNQGDSLADDALIYNSKIEHIDLDEVQDLKLDLFLCTLPCTGASKAGRTKNKLAKAEDHDSAGACFFYALQFIKKFSPASVLVENVKEFLNTASYSVFESVLLNWGFDISVKVLNGNEYGDLENRDRMVLVANLKQLGQFDFEYVVPMKDKEKTLSECYEDVPLDSELWNDFSYLKAKQTRDKEAGKGFGVSLYSGLEASVITIRRTYHKAGSCDPYAVHPENPELWRKFTAVEHLRFKGIPLNLVDGCSETIAHEIAGQSGCFHKFVSVGAGIGINFLLSTKRFASAIRLQNEMDLSVFDKFGAHARVVGRNGKGFVLLTEAALKCLAQNGIQFRSDMQLVA
ncbi:DNA cytosine methyltransferase (plasmid) [Shewanella xiamenensis]|uniref:DNA (cytosine-5-)-methyltransferase n=1 Tax=Shewanella xiamenensis TaxID=332186 RepID=A0ABT6UFI7_9GAMM|nr:DNA cytosine methyltransferase [Shewanella xiamenensis]MDI5832495.1 DNA cytosine methyltransferase [Shewanella xiamenensis]WHF57886.1 DNA cytosine methyltransferase [Shewanella xiamenensis]